MGVVNRVCRFSVNNFGADACAIQYEIIVAKRPNYDFCISQGSVDIIKVMWPKLKPFVSSSFLMSRAKNY